MTDDDDLRDALGADITDVLGARAATGPTPDALTIEAVQRRARTTNVRRRASAAALAAVIVAASATVIATTRNQQHNGVKVATSPTAAPPTTGNSQPTASPGHKIVSYHGVHVEVPSSWPVVDGMHTGFCQGPFGSTPTAYIGPNQNGPPSCPPPLNPPPEPPPDGVWLTTQPRPQPEDSRPKRLTSGITVLEATGAQRTEDVWYHGVDVLIGLGADRHIATAILESIGYTPGLADTPRAGVCARGDSQTMPTPERLTKTFVIEHGNQILKPPEPGDRATLDPARLWTSTDVSLSKESYERYRIILTRYSAKLPAHQRPDGTLVPFYQHHLAWVIYEVPRSPEIQGCGMWGAAVYDANTGRPMGVGGWDPGP